MSVNSMERWSNIEKTGKIYYGRSAGVDVWRKEYIAKRECGRQKKSFLLVLPDVLKYNSLDKRKAGTYWANTSDNSLVEKLLRGGNATVKTTFEALLDGETLNMDNDFIRALLDDLKAMNLYMNRMTLEMFSYLK